MINMSLSLKETSRGCRTARRTFLTESVWVKLKPCEVAFFTPIPPTRRIPCSLIKSSMVSERLFHEFVWLEHC